MNDELHTNHVAGRLVATSAGDSSYQSIITGTFGEHSDVIADVGKFSKLQNHVGREFYKQLDIYDLVVPHMDSLDAGLRPLTFTGMYSRDFA